jgi:hypothetical protein
MRYESILCIPLTARENANIEELNFSRVHDALRLRATRVLRVVRIEALVQ